MSNVAAAHLPCFSPSGSSVKRREWAGGTHRMLPWEFVPPAQPRGPASQRGGDFWFYLFLYCNPSVIPPVFKDTLLIVLAPTKERKKKRGGGLGSS